MAIVSAVLIFVGLSRTYFFKFHFPVSPALSVLPHIHGFIFFCWILYFVTQTALITVNKPSLHRRLRLVGASLGSAVIVLGLLVAFTGARLHHGTPQQSWEVILWSGSSRSPRSRSSLCSDISAEQTVRPIHDS